TPPEFTEERTNPNDCQQEILSRKIGASRKHHKIRQLQQIITAIRHQGKTKTANFSLFFSGQIALEKFKSSAPKPFGTAFQTERQFGKGAIQVLRSLFTSGS